jgi:hypothetical protein
MPITVLDVPQTLFIDSERAAKDGVDMMLSPERVRRIAERWSADQEKIAYLE